MNQKALEQFDTKLKEVIAASKLQIIDQTTFVLSGDAKLSLESYIKAVNHHFAAEIAEADERLKRLKNRVATLVAPAEEARAQLIEHQRGWMAEEKRTADADTKRKQDEHNRAMQEKSDREKREAQAEATRKKKEAIAQINRDFVAGQFGKREFAKRLKDAGAEEEAAKATAEIVAQEQKNAPPPVVSVVPSIPKVAGVRNQTYYGADLEDGGAGIKAELFSTTDVYRRAFLTQFIRVDEAEISKFARKTKDVTKVNSLLPGVRAWSKG